MEQANWWENSFRYSSLSDKGMRRSNNQDSYKNLIAATIEVWRTRGHLFIVADGMGAHAAGEYASRIAVDVIVQSYYKDTDIPCHNALKNAFLQAHNTIKSQGERDEAFYNMGTTAVALLLLPEGALVSHVGDSRAYRYRQGKIEQLTFDHSLLWEYNRSTRYESNKLPPERIPKNVITRSLGSMKKLDVDQEGFFPLIPGDTFLLCSDGLSGQVTDEEMGQILNLLDPEEATEFMINLANLRGGPDNITVTIVKFLEMPDVSKLKPLPVLKKKRVPFSFVSLLFLAATLVICIGSILLFFLQHSLNPIFITTEIALFSFLTFGFFCTARPTLFPEVFPEVTGPLGNGPYTSNAANPDTDFAQKLVVLREQIIEAITAKGLGINFNQVERWIVCSEELKEKNQTSSYLRMNIKIINFLFGKMKEYKRNMDTAKHALPTTKKKGEG